MTLQSKRDELIDHYRRSFDELRQAIEGLSDAQMSEVLLLMKSYGRQADPELRRR